MTPVGITTDFPNQKRRGNMKGTRVKRYKRLFIFSYFYSCVHFFNHVSSRSIGFPAFFSFVGTRVPDEGLCVHTHTHTPAHTCISDVLHFFSYSPKTFSAYLFIITIIFFFVFFYIFRIFIFSGSKAGA